MELFDNLILGFSVAGSPMNILLCLVGVMVGTLIGVLPGIGPVGALAMLLPVTFYLTPTGALIMLAGIYYGAQYGGSTTAILVNMPGESSSVVTCLDGHQMARKGRAGSALAIAALGSFFAGTVSTLLIAVAAVPLSRVALSFGSPEYFSLMLLGLVGAVVLASGSIVKAIGMIVLGVCLGLVGTDVSTGVQRFTFGSPTLMEGIDFVTLALGIMGVTEIILNLARREATTEVISKIESLWPSREEAKASVGPVVRGTLIGSVLGLLPGGGGVLASYASYTMEKKLARDPRRFGNGAVEGLAGPESANNAGAQTSFIPMLTLGIPSNAVMALLVGAMMIQGIAPGPDVMLEQPELFWGIIASMWIGNAMLLVINLPLIGLWVSLLKVPYRLLCPCIALICAVGAYSVNYSITDLWFVAGFAFLGYIFKKVGCEAAPLVLGFILGPGLEENLRRSMVVGRGDPMIFLNRPISLALLTLTAVLILFVVLPHFRQSREVVFQDD